MDTRIRQERAVLTRERILSASVNILVTHGYAGLTMARVQEAAGVSRGALTHHFASMTALAVAAVDFVAEAQAREIDASIVDADSLAGVVAVVHEISRRPTFVAGLQLWVAARTEPALRDALRPGARRLGHDVRRVLVPLIDDADADVFVDGLLSLLRGLAIGGVLRDRPEREKAVLQAWMAAFVDRPPVEKPPPEVSPAR